MPNPIHPYPYISLISVVLILIFGLCLLGAASPPEREFRNYRIARRLLSCSYFILAIAGLPELFMETNHGDVTPLILTITLIIASLQALLFTFSTITLIDMRFMTTKRVLRQLIPLFTVSAILVVALLKAPLPVFYAILAFSLGCYALQLIYYVWLFNREHKRYRNRMDNYFSGDEERRLRWVRQVFYIALGIGILAIVSLFLNLTFYIIFVITYSLFYVYFAMRYINYVSVFRYLLPAFQTAAPTLEPGTATLPVEQAIARWIEQKKFAKAGITLDSLANELNTNQTYLSRYINQQMNLNFKLWISNLRMEEARRLLREYPDKPIVQIAEEVGLPSKGSFFRQFVNNAGVTPGEYRKNHINMS